MQRKKLLVVYVFLLALAAGTMAALWALRGTSPQVPATPRDFEEIARENTLRMVTEYNQSGYYIAGDTIEGFQYELGRAISRLTGLEVQTALDMSLTESFRMLDAGEVDVVARNIPVNSEIRERYLFTDPIVLNKQVLVQRKAGLPVETGPETETGPGAGTSPRNRNRTGTAPQTDTGREAGTTSRTDTDRPTDTASRPTGTALRPLRNQLDLARKTVYVPKGSPALIRLRNLEHEIGDTIYIVEDDLYSSEQLAIMVAKGDIDFAVCDQQIALVSAAQLPEIDVETDISFTQLQAWAVRKDAPALRDSLNVWLERLRRNGTFDKIYQKYYGKKK